MRQARVGRERKGKRERGEVVVGQVEMGLFTDLGDKLGGLGLQLRGKTFA